MKINIIWSLAVWTVLAGCSRTEMESEHEGHAETAPSKNATNGVVVLDPAAQKLIGVKTAALEAASIPPGFRAFGNVVDASPLVTLFAEIASAQAASAASAAELARLEILVQQSNASERALETARAGAARDKASLESARLRSVATWGKVISNRKDLGALVQSLSSLQSALVQLNLPLPEPAELIPVNARFATIAQPGKLIQADYLAEAPAVDKNFQGRSYWFLVQQSQGRLVPGAAVNGVINTRGESQKGVQLPREAVLRHQGAAWVYVQTLDNSFSRVLVVLREPLEAGWFVSESEKVKPGEKVVVAGAQQLLSEELKAQVGE